MGKKNNHSKFEMPGYGWNFFLSEVLKSEVIIVTRKKMPKGQNGNF